jgi:hypothetical protein
MLCDLLWSGWHSCYMIFHIEPLSFAAFEPMIIVLAVFEPCYYLFWWFGIIGIIMLGRCCIVWDYMMGWRGVIQDYEMGRFGILPRISVFFQPLRCRGRVIWKSEDASLWVQGLVRPVTPLALVSTTPIMWGNLYTSIELIESIRIATSLEWADVGMRYYD